MVTVHREPVIDSRDEMVELYEGWDNYLEATDEYSRKLLKYRKAAAEDIEGVPHDVESFLDDLIDSYDEMTLEKAWVEKELDESSLRGHASYPDLDVPAIRDFRQVYGVAPGKMKEENPRDFFYTVVNEFVDRKGVEWQVESKQIGKLDELHRMIQDCENAARMEIQAENPELPETGVEGVIIGTDAFDELLEAYMKTSRETLYRATAPYERHLFEQYDRSALEELLGVKMNLETLDSLDSGDSLSALAD